MDKKTYNEEGIDFEDLDFSEEENSINEDEKLSLQEYFDLCLKFEQNPTDDNLSAIQHFLSQLQIKSFLPLKDKTIITITIARDLIDELDSSGAASTLEINKLFKGLLAYVVNLKNDIGLLELTFVAYDFCYIYGLVDAILQVCAEDYKRLCSYIDSTINVSNAYRLIQTASILNDTEYVKWVNTLNELKEKITPEMLKSLLAIDVMNNGGSNLQDTLGELAAQEANTSIKESEAKYQKIGEDLDVKLNHKNEEK